MKGSLAVMWLTVSPLFPFLLAFILLLYVLLFWIQYVSCQLLAVHSHHSCILDFAD